MAELFHYTFATDLSEFATTSASNATIEQAAGAGLNGTTGGVLCTRTGTPPVAWGRVDHTLNGLSAFRMAFFCDLSSISILTNNHDIDIYNGRTNAEGFSVAGLRVVQLAGVYYMRFRVNADGAGIGETDIAFTNRPTWIEMAVERETVDGAADGNIYFYFGGGDYPATGLLVHSVTNYDNIITFNACTRARYGIVLADTSVTGSLKVDEIIARDDNEPILFGVSTSTFPFLTYLRRRRRD